MLLSQLLPHAKQINNIYGRAMMLDILYDELEDRLISGEYATINSWLQEIDVEEWPDIILIAISTITLPFRNWLHIRNKFMSSVNTVMINRYGSKKAKKLLSGLI